MLGSLSDHSDDGGAGAGAGAGAGRMVRPGQSRAPGQIGFLAPYT